jgi:hypothetical protein
MCNNMKRNEQLKELYYASWEDLIIGSKQNFVNITKQKLNENQWQKMNI